jgi:hypothetical protein
MKRSTPFILIILSLLIASFACNVPQITSPTPTPTETATATIPPTDPQISPTNTPAILVPSESPPTPIPEPTPLPYQPAGYYSVPVGGGSILVYDLNNQMVSQLSAPGLYGDNPSYAHLSGRLSNGAQDFSAIFFSWESFSLSLSDLNGVTPLLNTQNFYMLAGIPSQPYIAFVNLEYADAGLLSYLTIGDPANLPNAPAVMTVLDTDGYAVRPLAFADDQGQPLGVYYTSVPYGIGGDIVFEPRRSLRYLDLSTNQSRDILGIGSSPAGLSPDLTWLAYTALFNGPLTISPISDLSNPITLPLLPGSDRGAGSAVFSPDNQYIAWKEGSGWMMSETPNFQATIRIATTSGAITAQIPDSTLIPLIGNPTTIWIEPVGWLDNGTLLIEVRGDDWEQASLFRVNPDGSGLASLVPGSFMGFIYP